MAPTIHGPQPRPSLAPSTRPTRRGGTRAPQCRPMWMVGSRRCCTGGCSIPKAHRCATPSSTCGKTPPPASTLYSSRARQGADNLRGRYRSDERGPLRDQDCAARPVPDPRRWAGRQAAHRHRPAPVAGRPHSRDRYRARVSTPHHARVRPVVGVPRLRHGLRGEGLAWSADFVPEPTASWSASTTWCCAGPTPAGVGPIERRIARVAGRGEDGCEHRRVTSMLERPATPGPRVDPALGASPTSSARSRSRRSPRRCGPRRSGSSIVGAVVMVAGRSRRGDDAHHPGLRGRRLARRPPRPATAKATVTLLPVASSRLVLVLLVRAGRWAARITAVTTAADAVLLVGRLRRPTPPRGPRRPVADLGGRYVPRSRRCCAPPGSLVGLTTGVLQESGLGAAARATGCRRGARSRSGRLAVAAMLVAVVVLVGRRGHRAPVVHRDRARRQRVPRCVGRRSGSCWSRWPTCRTCSSGPSPTSPGRASPSAGERWSTPSPWAVRCYPGFRSSERSRTTHRPPLPCCSSSPCWPASSVRRAASSSLAPLWTSSRCSPSRGCSSAS